MNTLVTGANGFLGSHLIEQGQLMGHAMLGLDGHGECNFQQDASRLLGSDLILANIERVIHCAGTLGTQETIDYPEACVENNVLATLKVLKACRIAGAEMTYITLGNQCLNPYTITKNCAAGFVRMFAAVHGLRAQVVVLYNLFGPRQKWEPVRKIVPEFMTRLIAGKPVQLFNSGKSLVDMTYVVDAARAILGDEEEGDRYHGSAAAVTVESVARACAVVLGVEYKAELLGARPGETGAAAIAPHPIAQQTPFGEALRITAEWYRKNYNPQ